MNWHNCLGTRGNSFPDGLWIDVERMRVNVHENRLGADPRNGSGGGDKRERGGDDLVGPADFQCHQSKNQRVRTRCAANGMTTASEYANFLFKCLNFWAKDEMLALQHALHRFDHLLPTAR